MPPGKLSAALVEAAQGRKCSRRSAMAGLRGYAANARVKV
jgi:hypothetical protein